MQSAYRVVTGCYDRVLRIWNLEGKMIQKIECFMEPISSLCFVARTETIWVAAGTAFAYVIDLKTGDNVRLPSTPPYSLALLNLTILID